MAVRALYSNHTIEYSPEFLILLATNHKPNIASMDFGIWRRLLIIPFEVNFTDAAHNATRDPHLETYFKEHEGPGILNWMIEGYKMWMAEGMGAESEASLPRKLFNLKKEFKQGIKLKTPSEINAEEPRTVGINAEPEVITSTKH